MQILSSFVDRKKDSRGAVCMQVKSASDGALGKIYMLLIVSNATPVAYGYVIGGMQVISASNKR